MIKLNGNFYTGDSSAGIDASIDIDNNGMINVYDDSVPVKETTVSPRLGNASRFITFPDGVIFETRENDAVDQIVAQYSSSGQQFARSLERSMLVAVFLFAILATGAAYLYIKVIPWGARHIAYSMSLDFNQQLSRASLESMDRTILKLTQLPQNRRTTLLRKFDELRTTANMKSYTRLQFRHSDMLGANAFAFPSGDIVITDGLVELSANDQELLAVLAHEIGHVENRHSLRSVLQNSALVVMTATLMGDATTFAYLAETVPLFLAEQQYSRDFEREADRYALELLKKHGIDQKYFSSILERMEKAIESGNGLSFLSSHPASEERISSIKEHNANK